MYSVGNHNHYGSGGLRLYLQRFLCSYRAFVAIFIVFLFTIFLYYYNESLLLLKNREIEGNRCQQKLDSISAQLQVVYEHKSRLEKALTGDREACNKKMDEVNKNLKTAKEAGDKSGAELKALQKTQTELQKQVTELKAEKDASEKALNKSGIDSARAKETYAKEMDAMNEENNKMNALVVQLQTALNKSADQIQTLQQQLLYMQQIQKLPYNPAAQAQLANQPLPTFTGLNQQAILVAPVVNGSQVPQLNVALPPIPQLSPMQPQPEQLAVPMAEQQQQLLAQQQVPLQQPVGQAGAPAMVLQHPLGEDQQQLMMARPNNVAVAPGAPPIVQAPPPAALNNSAAVQAPAADQGGDGDAGGGAGYHDVEPFDRRMEQNVRPGDDYKDDDEEAARHKDFDTER